MRKNDVANNKPGFARNSGFWFLRVVVILAGLEVKIPPGLIARPLVIMIAIGTSNAI